jgi:hypothetical protein
LFYRKKELLMKLTKKLLGIAAIIAVIVFLVLPLTGCPEDGDDSTTTTTTTTTPSVPEGFLPPDTWADGTIAVGGEQWFKFTATAEIQYIHFQPGTLSDVHVQLYEADGTTTKGTRVNLYSSYINTSWTLTSGNVYNIKVTPYSSSSSGTYKIGFNSAVFSPILITVPTTSATSLTADTWTDGSISTASGEQWFKFTATAATHYIHFQPGTLTSVYVQLYTNDGRSSQSRVNLHSSNTNTSRTSLTSDNVYYIKVTPNSGSGAYKIAFNSETASPGITLPTEGVTQLTADSWEDGSITTAGGVQWFKFKATAATHYIHFLPGTLTSVYVQLYTSDGRSSGNTSSLSSSTINISLSSLTSNNDYYIKVTAPSSYSGAYKIAFNSATASPGITLPTEGVTQLTADSWEDGSITTAGGEQWFKFTATAATHYIHFQPGTLIDIYVQLYTDDGKSSGMGANLWGDTLNISRTLTSGNVYYIKIKPYSSSSSGTYKIGFNSTALSPPITVPTENVIELTNINTWYNGSIATASGEQWFKFTTTAATHYIYFQPGTLTSVYVQLYTNDGRSSQGRVNLYSSNTNISRTSLTSGNVYYIKVTPSSSSYSGAYKIGFGTTNTLPN